MHKTYKDFCPLRYKEIENYDLAEADSFKGWICHHKLGEHCFTKDELIKFGLYDDVTPGELIFMKRQDHMKLHKVGAKTQFKKGCGKPLSEEHKKHISENSIGKPGTFTGKNHTNATKKHIGDTQRNRKWFTNGIINIKTYECPPDFKPGMTRK